jgi:hypothetical protein
MNGDVFEIIFFKFVEVNKLGCGNLEVGGALVKLQEALYLNGVVEDPVHVSQGVGLSQDVIVLDLLKHVEVKTT